MGQGFTNAFLKNVRPHKETHYLGGQDTIVPTEIGAITGKKYEVILKASDWDTNIYRVTIDGLTLDDDILIAPEPLFSGEEYSSCKVFGRQMTGYVQFECTEMPTNDLTVYIIVLKGILL